MGFSAITSTRDANEPVGRRILRQEVMSRILTAVFQGRFVSGQRLVVQRLAEQYGVSPTPVREALVELSGLGIVDLLPNRGAAVRPFGRAEVREISQVRRVLEVEATRCACGRAEPAELRDLEAELVRLSELPRTEPWDRDVRAADNWLHGMIAESCGSLRLKTEIGRYLGLFRALRDVLHARDAGSNYAISNDTLEHLEIVRPLAALDAEGAAQAMDRHIRTATKNLEAIFDGEAMGTDAEARPLDRA
jgi:DNA-binding GntR family transcriptional regulator